ncbi:hypothetical protein NADFUDRAFT_66483 [Nadsonia fulvescens var. elongata DSM 6958]|uniref:Vacuolar protein sorting-associated protein 51 homolog n=1 Tax=Nadsonia fulvescens var. elongata DSM 6958 TaxID=857566 RepID=A0A1E3PJ16_9ASCO|nr:hypothetical protein NADFUDRAFT_66483 [Nadsonia fulvescens var. elongata DSM 6958]
MTTDRQIPTITASSDSALPASTPHSPAFSTQSDFDGSSPSIISSTHSSHSHTSSRRSALREFYKIQQQNQRPSNVASGLFIDSESVDTITESDLDNRQHDFLDEDDLDDGYDDDDLDDINRKDNWMNRVIDTDPQFQPSEYVDKLFHGESGDVMLPGAVSLKSILKQETDLLASMRALKSEQKALVYNNYNKLINASVMLHGLERESTFGSDDEIQALRRNLFTIESDLTRLPTHLITKNTTTAKTTIETTNTQLTSDGTTPSKKTILRYILHSPTRLQSMLSDPSNTSQTQAAHQEFNRIQKLVSHWLSSSDKASNSLNLVTRHQLELVLEGCQALFAASNGVAIN